MEKLCGLPFVGARLVLLACLAIVAVISKSTPSPYARVSRHELEHPRHVLPDVVEEASKLLDIHSPQASFRWCTTHAFDDSTNVEKSRSSAPTASTRPDQQVALARSVWASKLRDAQSATKTEATQALACMLRINPLDGRSWSSLARLVGNSAQMQLDNYDTVRRLDDVSDLTTETQHAVTFALAGVSALPFNARVLLTAAQALERVAKIKQAREFLDRIFQLRNKIHSATESRESTETTWTVEDWADYAEVLGEMGRVAEAVECLQTALRIFPTRVDIANQLLNTVDVLPGDERAQLRRAVSPRHDLKPARLQISTLARLGHSRLVHVNDNASSGGEQSQMEHLSTGRSDCIDAVGDGIDDEICRGSNFETRVRAQAFLARTEQQQALGRARALRKALRNYFASKPGRAMRREAENNRPNATTADDDSWLAPTGFAL